MCLSMYVLENISFMSKGDKNMKPSERKLLLKIARNQEPQDVFDSLKKGKSSVSAYSKIVNAQLEIGITEMHLPEPWNGHLSDAEVMIISSNPSLAADEMFPTKKWSDDDIANFFDCRFAGNQRKVRFWTCIAKYVSWIVGKDAEDLDSSEILDRFVVSTEIVHCKSKGKEGVDDCVGEEVKFLDEIINLFSGKYVIILGDTAKRFYEDGVFKIKGKKVAFMHEPTFPQSEEERKASILKQLKL